MVKEVKCYEDASGKLHKSAYDPHRADLVLWLMQGGALNEASAKSLADRMADECAELQSMLDALRTYAPPLDLAA